MEKQYQDILKDDFDSMRKMLKDIERHLLTQDFNHAFQFYRPLRDIIFEATRDVHEHKRGLQDIGDALLDITLDDE